MIAQVASASLVSENKVLCHPASVDSIPSSAGKEDHVSMGSISGAQAREHRPQSAIGAGNRAFDRGARCRTAPSAHRSRGVEAAHAAIRAAVPALDDDRPLYADIAKVSALIENGELLAAVSRGIGELG